MRQYRNRFVFLCRVASLAMFVSALFLYPLCVRAAIDTTATWTFKTGGSVYSSPTYIDGSVYIGSDDGNLYRLNASTGTMVWEFQTGGIIRCKPAVVDSVVYFESDDGNLYAIDQKAGTEIWSLNIGNKVDRVLPSPVASSGNYWDYMQSSPCVDSGTVYVGSGDSSFYAVDAQSGTLKWKTKTGGLVRSSPCVNEGTVYVGSFDGFIYSFNKTDGSVVWRYDTHGSQYKNVQPSPRVADGILYCGSRNPEFYALDAKTGSLIWSHDFGSSWVESSAAIANGVVYVGSSDLKEVLAFDAKTGTVVWTSEMPGDEWSSPFYYNGTLYIGLASYGIDNTFGAGGGLLAIDAATGNIKWQCNCGSSSFIGGVVSSPTVDEHMIYYGSLDGNVYAVDTAFVEQPKWCAADFKSSVGNGRQGFYVPCWASGSIARVSSRATIGYAGYLLQGAVDISPASPKFATVRDSVPVESDDLKATAISFMIYLPANMPSNGIIEFFVSDAANDSAAIADTIGAQAKKGVWTTLWLGGLDRLAKSGKFDPTTPKTVGVAIYYPAPYDTTKWAGNVEFRELWVYGFSFPSELIDDIKNIGETPKDFHLYNNYPNPFNPSTVINYQLSVVSQVTLRIYDTLGREVATMVNEKQGAGTHTVVFNGSRFSSGVYFYSLAAGGLTDTKKMMIIK